MEPTEQETSPTGSSRLDGMIAAGQLLGFALSARVLLLLGLLGTFVIGVMAMLSQTSWALAVLAVSGTFLVLPVAWLEIRRRSA